MARRATRRSTGSPAALGRDHRRRPEDQRGLPARRSARRRSFRAGQFDTGFIDRNLEALGAVAQPVDEDAVAARRADAARRAGDSSGAHGRASRRPTSSSSPWSSADGFQLLGPRSVGMPLLGRRSNGRSRTTCASAWATDGAEHRRIRSGVSRWTDGFVDDRRASRARDGGLIVLRNGRQTRVAASRSLRRSISSTWTRAAP